MNTTDAIADLDIKYNAGVPYLVIIDSFAYFLSNPLKFIEKPGNKATWKAFLDKLREIERTIPTYAENNGEEDDHHTWLKRVLIFVRAYLEENEVLASGYRPFEFYKPLITKHDIFHPGRGTKDPDLVDTVTKELYDVKHNSSDFKKAHDADFIIKYQDNGICTIHSAEKYRKGEPTYIGGYIECRSVSELATSVGLPADIFSKSEEDLEELFAYND